MIVCPVCSKSDCSHVVIEHDIADFSGGRYYDQFKEGDPVPQGLEHEIAGSETRARYYARLMRGERRVLDCGCGNGLTVEHLRDAGFDAWGTDVSALRKWQWRERRSRDHLVVTDGEHLPFDNGFFDAIISSGVLEHIGVDELAITTYQVLPRATRDAERRAFVSELLRVLAPRGVLFLDFPNGAFPVDYWHGGKPRRHGPNEGFLPTFTELRALFDGFDVELTALSPWRRLEFRQHGGLLAPLGRAYFASMKLPLLRRLAASRFNPFLVVKVKRNARAPLPK
jgi:SAM-dependent methyltransferase